MKEIVCPECGTTITDGAASCPNCGCSHLGTITKTEKQNTGLWTFMILMMLTSIYVVIFAWFDVRILFYISFIIAIILCAVLCIVSKWKTRLYVLAFFIGGCAVMAPFLIYYFKYHSVNSVKYLQNKEIVYFDKFIVRFDGDYIILQYENRQKRYLIDEVEDNGDIAVYGQVSVNDMMDLFGQDFEQYFRMKHLPKYDDNRRWFIISSYPRFNYRFGMYYQWGVGISIKNEYQETGIMQKRDKATRSPNQYEDTKDKGWKYILENYENSEKFKLKSCDNADQALLIGEDSPYKNFEGISAKIYDLSNGKKDYTICVFFKNGEPRYVCEKRELSEPNFGIRLLNAWDDRSEQEKELERIRLKQGQQLFEQNRIRMQLNGF